MRILTIAEMILFYGSLAAAAWGATEASPAGGSAQGEGTKVFAVLCMILLIIILLPHITGPILKKGRALREALSMSPLHRAVRKGDRDLVRDLISHGVDPDKRTFDGYTPLHYAIMEKKPDLVPFLLEKCDREARDRQGRTALMLACMNGDLKSFDLLVKKGCTLTGTDLHGDHPLHLAVEGGNIQIVKRLIEKEADTAAAGSEGDTPLHRAACAGDSADMEELEAKGVAKFPPGYQKGGLISIARLLLEHGAPLNAVNESGDTPLHAAVTSGYIDMVKLMLEREAALEATTEDGETSLHCAAGDGLYDIAELLLKRGANVTAATREGQTPLHEAARWADRKTAELLLTHGAVVNSRDNDGNTPLHFAAENDLEVVKFLVSRNGDHTAINKDNDTPLDIATQCGNKEIAAYLLELKSR